MTNDNFDGLVQDGMVHLPAFMEAVFDMPRSRARMLIDTGNVRVAGWPCCHEQDVPANGGCVVIPSGRYAWLPKATQP